jgi:nucleoside-diphosphate-sugar epimerase
MKNISILGCGWLGFPLAKALLAEGFNVKGTTTSPSKLSDFEQAGIASYVVNLTSEAIVGDIDAFLENTAVLIIAIPPKLRGPEPDRFDLKIDLLIPLIENAGIENVLFISSTSVYGENNTIVTEEHVLNPDTESGKQLVVVENNLQKNTHFKTTVLRFGGLIGENRHPIKFLAGRENIENPDAPINLIHQKDCIGIILKIIEQEAWYETFNAVCPFHPSRESYYTQKAIEYELPLPKFRAENTIIGRTIVSDKIIEKLGYTFKETKL